MIIELPGGAPPAGGGSAVVYNIHVYFVYAIYNKIAKKFYIGQSENLKERLRLHNEKQFRGYTSRFAGSWEVIYSEKHDTRAEAIKREKQLKSYRGREFVKKYIDR